VNSAMESAVAGPYAQAFMAIAKGNNLVDNFANDVSSVLELLRESDDLKQFLSNPLIKADAKRAALRQILGDSVHPYTLNFLMLLVDKGRILFLEGICKQYQALVREMKQIVLAEVTSAVPLSDEQKEAVRQKVVQMTGASEAELEMSQDPELIGGVVIEVGSQVIDASLRGQLRRIGLQLSNVS